MSATAGAELTLGAAALLYAPRTVALRPRSKQPVLKDWPNWEASEQAVTVLWEAHPDYNVGIRLGGGLAALDIDPRAGGDDVLADLEHEHGELPATVTVYSGGSDRGRHIYFKTPQDVVTTTIGAGLQLRARANTGQAQMCVAPPSLHPDSGRAYEFAPGLRPTEIAIAPLPAWLAPAVAAGARGAGEWMKNLDRELTPGDRHNTLLSMAAYLAQRRVSPKVAVVLLASFNRQCCAQPLPTAELVEIARWAARKEGLDGNL